MGTVAVASRASISFTIPDMCPSGAGCVYSGSIRLASAAATWPLGVVGVGIKRPAARHPVVGHAAMQGLFGLAFGLFVGRALGFLAPATVHH